MGERLVNRWIRLGIVLAGYALAMIVSGVVVALFDWRFTPADNQAMGGMIAGGEMMLGVAVFAVLSLVPTALALYFLRHQRALGSAFSTAGLAFSLIGLVAVLAPVATGWTAPRAPWLALVELVGLAQMLGAPITIAGFALFAALAPSGGPRRRWVAATVIEVVIGACGVVHFRMPASPF